MRFIDAHHHLWDLGQCNYPWLNAKNVKRFFGDPTPIQKNYLPADFLGEHPLWVPEKSVHIQVGVQESDSLEESRWLQSLGEDPEGPAIPNAIVAFADLSAPDATEQVELQAAITRVRGIRQIVGRHIKEDLETGTDRLISNPAWEKGLHLLASSGLSFDLQLIPQQYEPMKGLLDRVDGLQVAICHLGSPWDQSPEGFDHWRHSMRAFAKRPETCLKISGFGMFDPTWTEKDIRPWILESIEIFSPRRVMFGSNFPVDKLYGSYERIWSAYDSITRGFNVREREDLFAATAERFYRI